MRTSTVGQSQCRAEITLCQQNITSVLKLTILRGPQREKLTDEHLVSYRALCLVSRLHKFSPFAQSKNKNLLIPSEHQPCGDPESNKKSTALVSWVEKRKNGDRIIVAGCESVQNRP